MRRGLASVLIAMLLVGGTHAQTPGGSPPTDWTDVMGLPEGARVIVVDDRGRRHEGLFEEADDQTIRIRRRRTAVTLQRPEVVSIAVRDVIGASRRPAILGGAAKGGVTGFVRGGLPLVLLLERGSQIALASGVVFGVLGGAIAAKKAAKEAPRPTYGERVIYVRQ
jgi:hypothetical protein